MRHIGAELSLGVVLDQAHAPQQVACVRSVQAAMTDPDCPPVSVFLLGSRPDGVSGDFGAVVSAPAQATGFAAGQTALMSAAFGAGAVGYVCVSANAILHPRCLTALWQAMLRAKNAGLVEALRFPDERAKLYDPGTHATPWCAAGALLISRSAFAAVDGFDLRFDLHCADVDLSWRARAAGLATLVAPAALVFLDEEPSAANARPQLLRGALALASKYGDASSARACARELEQLGERFEPVALERPSPVVARFADFSHGLEFAQARW